MHNKYNISIVVPVYNVANFLDECIKTILDQSYDDFELILVDDGSTDESGSICDYYSKLDERVKVIHQKNGGLSDARNTGINISNGQFITFIDSDDYVAKDYIEKLYFSIIENNADICMCDFKKVSENSKLNDIKNSNSGILKPLLFDKNRTIEEVYYDRYHGIDFVSWAKIYKIELFKSNNISFPKGKLHEDAFTTYKLIYLSKRICYIDAPLYFYRIRKGSIMTNEFSIKRLDMIDATREEYQFFKNNQNYNLMRLALYDHLHKVKYILKMLQASNEETKEITKKVCKDLEQDIKESRKYISIPLIKYLYYKGLARYPKAFILIGNR